MPKSSIISFKLDQAGLSLSAQLLDSNGRAITPLINTGFASLGSGYYTFDYTAYPENFRGSIRITPSTDASVILYVASIDTNLFDVATIPDFAYDYGETLTINYSDVTSKKFYAILFNAYDLNQAYDINSAVFASYTLATQSNYVINMIENSEKLGYYTASIANASTIPKVNETNYYLIEVWERTGDVVNRSVDRHAGYLRLYWGGDASNSNTIARAVWTYEPRSLSQAKALNVSSVGSINILPATTRTNGVITF